MDGAEWLVHRGAGLVAADFPGLGTPGDDRYEVKRALHRGGALTVEQLTGLAPLAATRWHLAACPLRIRGTAGSLLRAAALVGFTGREIIDLSLDIYPGMTALGGAVPTFWTRASHELTSFFYKDELSYQTTSMLLSEHAGTHIDAPYHFDPDGAAIEAMPLDALFARARMLDLTAKRPLEGIGPEDLDAALRRLGEPIEPGDAAVVWTEHSRNYERPDYTHHRPFITAEGRPGWPRAGRDSWRPTWSGWTSRSTTSPPSTTAFCGGNPPAPGPDQPRPPGRPRSVRRGLPPEARRRHRLAAARLRRARLDAVDTRTSAPMTKAADTSTSTRPSRSSGASFASTPRTRRATRSRPRACSTSTSRRWASRRSSTRRCPLGRAWSPGSAARAAGGR